MSLARTYVDLFRRNRALARLLAGEFISGIGDWLYLVAVLVVVYAESNSAVLLGVVGAARILPYVLLSVPAGIVADRFDRRMVLLVTDVARGILMLVLVAAVMLGAPTIVIVALSILAACFSTFFGPAIAALLPMLVDESDLGPANSAWATLDNLAFILGPALAGILLATGALEIAFLLNAVSFAVVAVVLWRLPVPRASAPVVDPAGGPVEAPAGWRALVRPLAGPFVLDSVTSIVGGGVGVLTVVIAVDVLSAGEAGTGYLNAATGVGGVVAGVAGGALLARRLSVPLLLGGVVGGVGLAWLALSGDLVTAMLAIGVAVAGLLLLDVVNTTLIQRIVPDELRGRAMGVMQTTSAILYSLGSLLMPLIAEATSVGAVLIGSAVITGLGVAAALLLSERAADASPIDPARARLLEHPIFAGLPVPRLEAAARALEPVPVTAGQVVIRQGDPADRFYVIGAGSLRVTQLPDEGEAEVELRTLGPGDVFGEIGILRRSPRTASVTAATDGTLLALDAAEFLELVGSGPGLSSRLLDLYRGSLAR
ncbi:MAG TPA: MFS transporter [Candidatus Limnocylindrales bacterium]|nr:MFS transporter [Candidatus Limnocylindrales bacterium]